MASQKKRFAPPASPDKNQSLNPHDHDLEATGAYLNYIRAKDRFYSLKVLQPSRTGRVVAYWLTGLFVVLVGALFLPWQQNVQGKGKVTTFLPDDRPQQVNATISGRIEDWFVREGQYVKKGDPIMKIVEVKDKYLDPNTPLRFEEQVAAKESSIAAMKSKVEALQTQIGALQAGRVAKLGQAQNKLLQAGYKVNSDSMDLEAAKVDFSVAEYQFNRQQELYNQGLKSLTELETRKLKFQESKAKLNAVENKLAASRQERINAKIELAGIEAEYLDKISKSESDRASTLAYIADSEASLAKLRNELANVEIRQGFYIIRAPQDGYVVKTLKAGIGEMVKDGDPVATVMPESMDLAVELYVKPMDVPLLQIGRKVRIQFDGWPALQFSGWPAVSVGTFGGEIAVVDFVNSPDGQYRILITPDPDDEAWPAELRVGSGVLGWAMLDEVPIWFEIWRQLNGFPPSLKNKPSDYDLHPEKYKYKKDNYSDEEDGK